jgi:hypothetical protein
MSKKISDRSNNVKSDVNNLLDEESRSRAVFVINSLVPKTPNVSLKRFGSKNNAGYVLANDISNEDYLLSFGVAQDINFERQLSELVEGSDMYDNSVDGLPYNILNLNFFKEKIGAESEDGLANMKKCLSRLSNKKDYILKVDIEGSEWEFLSNITTEELLMFRQIVVEFHWIDKILDNDHYKIIKDVMEKINISHQSVNVHANNYSNIFQFLDLFIPEALEVTFLRKNSYSFSDYDEKNYFELNSPCNPNLVDINLIYKNEIK